MDFSDYKTVISDNKVLFSALTIHIILCVVTAVIGLYVIAFYGVFDLMFMLAMMDKSSSIIKPYYGIFSIHFAQLLLATLLIWHFNDPHKVLLIINAFIALPIMLYSYYLHRKSRQTSR